MILKFEVTVSTDLNIDEVQERIDEYLNNRKYKIKNRNNSDIVFNSEGIDKRWYLGGPMYNYVDYGVIKCIESEYNISVSFKFSFFLLKGIPIIFGSFLVLMGLYVSYSYLLILIFFVVEYLISILIIKQSFVKIFR